MEAFFYGGEQVRVTAVEPEGDILTEWFSVGILLVGADAAWDLGEYIPGSVTFTFPWNANYKITPELSGPGELWWHMECLSVGDQDVDGDGVDNDVDVCPGTELDLPEGLKKNRFAADADGIFVDGEGTPSGYSVADTGGCSGEQIVAAAGLGKGHERFGITRSALEAWIASLA